MKKIDDENPVTGVFIFSREVKNNGRIISEGTRPVTHIQTNKYSGRGVVQSIENKPVREKLSQTWWGKVVIGLFITVGGGLILFFITSQ